MRFKRLKLELDNFFKEYELDGTLFFGNWGSLKRMLIDILADCPLSIKKPKIGQIKSFHFKKGIKKGRSVLCDIDYEKKEDGGHYGALIGII